MPASVLVPRSLGNGICRALRLCDGQLLAVILVGSFVYTPKLAQDIDLVLISAAPQDARTYARAVRGALPVGLPVDIIMQGVDQPLGALRLGVAAGAVLWSVAAAAAVLESAVARPADFAEARDCLLTAETLMATGAGLATDQAVRFAQEAFQALFHAARTAAMVLIGLQARCRLPVELQVDFEQLIEICHIRYGCLARFPDGASAVQAEFVVWKARAGALISAAAAAAQLALEGREAGRCPSGPPSAMPPMGAAEESAD